MAVAAISNMDLDKVFPIAMTFAGVTVLALLGRVAISRYRKSLLKDSPQVGGPWSLDDLRDMKDSGQLTEQEYQALRQRMIRKTMDTTAGARGDFLPPLV
jgi:hypothetical protein